MSTPDFEALLSEFERTCYNYATNRAAHEPAQQQLKYVQECKAELRAYVQSLTPVWTDAVPTEPGWYWQRWVDYPSSIAVVEVKRRQDGTLMLPHRRSQWAGPIPQPQEPNKS